MALSDIIKLSADVAFQYGCDQLGLTYAKWRAEIRDLEERLQRAELRAALVSEEG